MAPGSPPNGGPSGPIPFSPRGLPPGPTRRGPGLVGRLYQDRLGSSPSELMGGPDDTMLSPDAYSGSPVPGPEDDPRGLMDRLYRDQLKGAPLRTPLDTPGAVPSGRVPTTRNAYP